MTDAEATCSDRDLELQVAQLTASILTLQTQLRTISATISLINSSQRLQHDRINKLEMLLGSSSNSNN